MMQILDDNDPALTNNCEYICSFCVNGNDCCYPFEDSCDWHDDFERLRLLLSKSFYLEEDPDCIYGTSEDNYDFDAQEKALSAVNDELDCLRNDLRHSVQDDQDDDIRLHDYETYGYCG